MARKWGGGATTVALLPALAGAGQRRAGLPLRGIGYDAEQDTLEIAVGHGAGRHPALRYFLPSPRRIEFRESAGGLAMLVEDASGTRTLVSIGGGDARAAGSVPPPRGGSG